MADPRPVLRGGASASSWRAENHVPTSPRTRNLVPTSGPLVSSGSRTRMAPLASVASAEPSVPRAEALPAATSRAVTDESEPP